MSKDETGNAQGEAGYDFNSYEKDNLKKPRDEAWDNWISWKDKKEGDKVQGYIRDAFYRPTEYKSDGTIAFREQRGITLQTPDGELVNVGVKWLTFVLRATDDLHVGDPLTIVWEKTGKPAEKGYNGAKIFGYYGKQLPQNADNPTVKQLTDEDRAAGGTSKDAEEDDTQPQQEQQQDADIAEEDF